MLNARDNVPHFDVTTITGTSVRYSALWQRKNLLLIRLAPDTRRGLDAYLARLSSVATQLAELNTEVVVTRDAVPGVDAGVVMADRWGEVCLAAAAENPGELPDVDELVEWARYLQQQCPECQGEAR